MKNRILAVILCITLVFSLSSVTLGVFADEELGDNEIANGDQGVSSEEGSADEGVTNNPTTEEGATDNKDNTDGGENLEINENDDSKFKMEFHPEGFVEQLGMMGIGMLGIFIVIGLIALATVAINKIFSGKEKKEN